MDIFFGTTLKFTTEIQNQIQNICNKFCLGQVKYTNENVVQVFGLNGEGKIIENKDFRILFDGYLSGNNNLLNQNIVNIAISVNSKCINHLNGLYNLVVTDLAENRLILFGDPSGNLPLYYYFDGLQLYYSTHLNFMAQILDLKPDYSGLAQKNIFGYTLGSRTYYEKVCRINPSEIITFEIGRLKLSSKYSQTYYSNYQDFVKMDNGFMENINTSFNNMRANYENLGLMLSEGFDSRFIGILAKENGFTINSYTHCTAKSLGKEIVKSVHLALNTNHFFNEINSFPTNKIELQNQLILSDNLNLPFWMEGADYFFNSNNNSPVMVGTALDTTLGGHAFYKPTKPIFTAVLQRYSEIFMQDMKLLSEKYIERLSLELLNNFKVKNVNGIFNNLENFYSKEISNLICPSINLINQQLEEEIERIKLMSSNPSQVLQRFFLENRVRKYSFGQELTIRRKNKIYIPTYEYGFMSILSSIHPKYKFNHKLYLDIMKKHMNSYGQLSNGTYGISANRNRLLLETSRFLHKQYERIAFRKLMKENGNLDPSNFRSAFLTDYLERDQNSMAKMNSLLQNHGDIVNKNGFEKYFEQIRDYKQRAFVHSTFYQALETVQIIKKEL